uniref:Uncharacterized protein n=1 Tax=Bactrocera latifrons TaxID=174628 RepID=A0A0K8W1B1_BACLA
MGDIQSKDNSNASDLEILELDKSENNSTLRRCSTFTDLYYQVSASKARLIRNGNRSKPLKMCTCQNYDPVYVLWKNGFENADLRAPRKIPPIKGKNRRIYDVTGVLAGQQTPKGFPLHTTLYKSLTSFDEDFSDFEYISSKQISMSLLPYEGGSSQKPLLDASSTFSATETAINRDHEEVPYEEGSSQEVVPYEEGSSQVPLLDAPSTSSVQDADQETVLSNINNEVQKEICMKDFSKVIPEDKSHGIQASFVCKMPAEQRMIIQNLMADQKQQNANKVTVAIKENQPKELICKNHRRKSFNWEYTVQQRQFIDLHDLGGCYYIF